ncbi:MAG: NAD-dependent epimerase/dehydratase family protein [Candidatus Moraniibacteriota bacterium]|nr:MAG: NAD-dependent epimerase/dehydratase family protein [Candidatus Moranbacteria bacterium]
MRILITGGAGFIGSHVADALIDRGHRVTIIDNLSSGSEENVNRRAKFYKVDIGNRKRLEKIFETTEPEAVLHFAAQINVRASVEDPSADAATNILGSLSLIELSAKHKVKKFIFSSTGGAMFDDTAPRPTPESVPAAPLSPYGIAKLTTEHYLRFFHQVHGLPYIVLRYANVYGPRQNAHGEAGVVSIFLTRLLDGQTPTINGDGLQTRDYVYVGDVAQANMLALDATISEGVFHIGTGIETSVNDIFRMLNWQFGKAFEESHGPAKSGEIKASALAAGKAKTVLQWEPKVALSEGLVATATWFKARSRES